MPTHAPPSLPSPSLPSPPQPATTARRLADAWPKLGTVPVATLVLILVAALVAAASLPDARLGLGVFVVGLLLVAATVPGGRDGAWSPERRVQTGFFTAATLALLAVPALRDAGWLVALCLLAVPPLAAYALAGGRSWGALAASPLALPWAALRVPRWQLPGSRLAITGRWVRTAALTAGLILLFGALFASADDMFDALIAALVPDLDLGMLPLRAFVFAFFAIVAAAAACLAAAPPEWDTVALRGPRRWSRTEWLVPVGAVNVLFLTFLAVQAGALAGGAAYVERTTGLTYAEYARQGFWQLVAVTVFTLALVAYAARRAPSAPADSVVVRATLAALCLQCLLVVASALFRLHLYEQQFGLTQLRLFVTWFSLVLGVVLILVLVAIARGSGRWLPRAVMATGAAALLALAAVNPDGLIASRNIDRWKETGTLDRFYLGGLSADAAPAIAGLPESEREPLVRCFYSVPTPEDSWAGANLARARARELLGTPRQPLGNCYDILSGPDWRTS